MQKFKTIQFIIYFVLFVFPLPFAFVTSEIALTILENIGAYRPGEWPFLFSSGKNTDLAWIVPLLCFVLGILISITFNIFYQQRWREKLKDHCEKHPEF